MSCCGNLQHANIIEGILIGLVFRVLPACTELGGTYRVGNFPVGPIYGIADGGKFAIPPQSAIARPGDIEYFFLLLSVAVQPALDYLYAIEVCTLWILAATHQEYRGIFAGA